MVNYEEKVFHPNLGICDVTGIDKKEKRMVITAADGSTCSIPFKSLPLVGVRNLMESDEADLILKKLFSPKQSSTLPASLTLMQIQQSIVDYKLEQQVQLLIGNMPRGKRESVIRNAFPESRVCSVRSCPLCLTFLRIVSWSVWRTATAGWHR